MADLLLPFVAALLGAAPAAAELTPNPPDRIAEAASDCWQALDGPGLQVAELERRGWKAGTIQANGKTVESPLRFYGKAKSSVLLMEMGSGGCVILSRVADPGDIGTSAQLLMNRLKALDGAVTGARQGQSIVYSSGPRAARLEPAGTMAKPTVRIAIVHIGAENK